MSTAKAISDVTRRIVELVAPKGTTNVEVTARSPDKAREGFKKNQINVFLYHSAINVAWRNQDLSRPAGKGQPSRPLLPLNLYYLITAYGPEPDGVNNPESDASAHEYLGRAMLFLHDNPELKFEADADLQIKNQVDPIRITPQPLTTDEVSKLWAGFQTPYRPSVAYEVGVVLIESELPQKSPLPVIRRGKDDVGWDSSASLPATITSVRFQTDRQPGIRLGDKLTVVGQNLSQRENMSVMFRHNFIKDRTTLPIDHRSDTEMTVSIPRSAAAWPPGVYMVCAIETTADGQVLTSNSIPVALLPEIAIPLQGLKFRNADGKSSLPLPCPSGIRAGQRVEAVVGSVEAETVDVSDLTTPVATWKQELVHPISNGSFVRIRVDGVDSQLFDPTNPKVEYDPRFVVKDGP